VTDPDPESLEEIEMKYAKAAVVAAALLLTVLFACQPALAQLRREHQHWEFSMFGGGSSIGSGQYATGILGQTAASRSVGLRYGDGYLLGASVTENRFPHLGATLEYTFSNHPAEFTNLVDTPASLGLRHSVHRVAYELVYYPLNSSARLRPFAFAGPGLTLFRVADKSILADGATHNLSDPWKFSWSWGGGVKYLIVNHWAASVQFTDSISGVPAYGLPASGYYSGATLVPGFHPDGFLHQKMLSIGVVYQWNR
jgi:opacity protein-like surface antigen